MRKFMFAIILAALGLGVAMQASASNGTGRELAKICNPQVEADAQAFLAAVLKKDMTPRAKQQEPAAGTWLQCESYMDGFIRGYDMAFQIGMGFTEYHLKQEHGVSVDDAEMRAIAAKELGLWYLCLPDPHSADMEAHVVSGYLAAHPEILDQPSGNGVKAAFDAAFTKPDGSCKYQP